MTKVQSALERFADSTNQVQPPFNLYEMEIRRALSAMEDRETPERAHEKFAKLCELATLAFPDVGAMTSEQISSDPVTPHLIRYFIRALTHYDYWISGEKESKTQERRQLLAEALMVEAVSGGGDSRGTRWTEVLKMQVIEAFSGRLYRLLSGVDGSINGTQEEIDAACADAFEVAYIEIFDDDSIKERKLKKRKENRHVLATFLIGEGYDFDHIKSHLQDEVP